MCTSISSNSQNACTNNKKKMDYGSLDPYEQQLLKVFNSYDYENRGSLDKEGLTQLCCTLQLEEHGMELVQQLTSSDSTMKTHVTFIEFKDALLVLLGNVQNKQTNDSDKSSPDREVLPKFVYGAKKYGRRSRPKIDEDVFNENTNYSNQINYNNAVQRSSSQSDVLHTKKRKTNTKLKRCTSFPGNHNYNLKTDDDDDVFLSNNVNNDQEFVCTEEMLRKAWEKLGVGKDGYLNQTELVLVCDAIGLHKLAKGVIRQLSHKLELDEYLKISFQELLEVLQQDDTWSEVLNQNATDTTLTTTIDCISNSVFPHPKMIQHITLGPDGTGYVNAEVVTEMWESVGISSPKLLLQGLGFVCPQICVSELATALEKELKGMHELKSDISNPYVVLLQAILTLYRSEIRCLKNILEQMHAERDKLKSDVVDANNRATLLAQEVDDNHARMEQNTQSQVKLLEQRHADFMKELAHQYSGEKEQLTQLNKNLEHKIVCLEADESKLQNDVLIAQEYSATIEKENHLLNIQLSELQQLKEVLTEQVAILENEKHNYELENQQSQIEPLLKKLSELQIENSCLKDKNDEMLTEIEGLNNQITVMRTKVSSTPTFHTLDQSMDDSISIVYEGASFGSKRRSDESPSKDLNTLCLGDGSPRLGKVRKCQKPKSDYLDVQIPSSESGVDTELDILDSSLSVSVNDTEEIHRLQAKITNLEKVLKLHSIPIPNLSLENENTSYKMKIKQLIQHSTELEDIIASVQVDLNKRLDSKHNCECESATLIKNITDKFKMLNEHKEISNDTSLDLKTIDANIQEQIQKYIDENKELVLKCTELENCIELLRFEYEKCEDYWASKLDEERQMFEQEQSQSNEKLTELIARMTEYEVQFNSQDMVDYRLPPIEEKFNLEKQFTDLELEFEEYKEQTEFQLAEKVNELAELKEKLNVIEHKTTFDKEVQVNLENRIGQLSNCLVESTNLFSIDTMPFEWCNEQTNTQPNSLDVTNGAPIRRDFVNPMFSNTNNEPKSELNENLILNIPNQTNQLWPVNTPNTSESTSTLTDNNAMPIRPKRTRKHENSYHKVQKLSCKKDDSKEDNIHRKNHTSNLWKNKDYDNIRTNQSVQTVMVPISTVHNLNGRLHHLEQRCRHLQMVLKQQHYHAERMLQHCWQQYRGEKAELQYLLKNSQEKLEHQMRICNEQLERLARTDILVKDLYVENAYLVANVQRLEKQCHILTQYNSSSTSV